MFLLTIIYFNRQQAKQPPAIAGKQSRELPTSLPKAHSVKQTPSIKVTQKIKRWLYMTDQCLAIKTVKLHLCLHPFEVGVTLH